MGAFDGLVVTSHEKEQFAGGGVGFCSGDGSIEQIAAAIAGVLRQFACPANGDRAAFDQNGAGQRAGECSLGTEPDASRGVVVGDHADDELRSLCSLRRRRCNVGTL